MAYPKRELEKKPLCNCGHPEHFHLVHHGILKGNKNYACLACMCPYYQTGQEER